MTERKPDLDDEDGLEPFFAAARHEVPEVDTAFLARVVDDAQEQAARTAAAGPEAARSARPFRPWRSLVAALFGWPGLAGLAAATLAGIWIGASMPAGSPVAADAWLAGILASSDDAGTEDPLDLLSDDSFGLVLVES